MSDELSLAGVNSGPGFRGPETQPPVAFHAAPRPVVTAEAEDRGRTGPQQVPIKVAQHSIAEEPTTRHGTISQSSSFVAGGGGHLPPIHATVVVPPQGASSKFLRVFRNYYCCEECTAAGSEWSNDALTVGPDHCPCCDLKAEPYASEELWDEYQDTEEETA